MAKPSPSPDQQAAINEEVTRKQAQQQAFTETAAAQDTDIDRLTEIDTAFKDLFDYYNDDIIGQYDAERKAINGEFVPSPITETDIQNVAANPPSGRLVPTSPVTDIIRVDEFDAAGYTGLDEDNEQQHISDQADIEDILQNGVSGTSPTVTATSQTASPLDASSTTLDMTDATGPMSFSIGDVFVVQDGGTDAAVVEVTGVTDNMGGDPPYDFTLDIIVRVPPSGTIAAGADVEDSFTGFTDGERITKTASDPNLQPLMDGLISSLEGLINDRLSRLSEQLTALGANDDPDATTEISTATTEATDSQTFLNNYLLSTDISDTGLSSLSTERGTRTTFLTTRLSEILAAYTGQTEDYYEQRYQTANNRGNTQRGTLREQANAQSVKDTSLAQAAALQGGIDALNGILP